MHETSLFTLGDIILIYFDTPRLNIEWFWSVIAFGGIPAICNPLSNNLETLKAHLTHINALFKQPRVLTTRKLADYFNLVPELRVTPVEDIGLLALPADAIEPSGDCIRVNEPAALLFTSGSTGNAKAVEFNHSQLLLAVKGKNELHKTGIDTNYLTWVGQSIMLDLLITRRLTLIVQGLDHSANLAEIHLNAMFNGSCQVHVLTADVINEPTGFLYLLARYRIGYTFAPNFFLRAVVRAFEKLEKIPEWDLRYLRVIMCAGEANRVSTIKEADTIITSLGGPSHTLKTAYGLSEVSKPLLDDMQGMNTNTGLADLCCNLL